MAPSALSTAGLGAALLVAAGAALAPTPAPRPLILMLPGRGYLVQDTAALRSEWLGALERGLAAAGGRALVAESDFRLVWYADALDPTMPAACRGERPARPGPRRSGEEIASVVATALTVAALVSDWSGKLDGAPLRGVAGDLLYFGDDLKRCAAEERLADALAGAARQGRPVVLIAHSFGSLVAHSHLSTRAAVGAPPVERWVTIGSLVGRPELRELLLGPEGRDLELPSGVGSWVNVRDRDDVLGAPLLGLRGDALATGRIADRVTAAAPGGDPHDPARYLSDPVTAQAVLDGWCAAGGCAAPPA